MAKNENEDKIDLGKLTEALEGLPEGVQNAVKDAIREVSGEQRVAADEAARIAASKKEDTDDKLEDFDVERVSRTELVGHLDKRFAKALDKALKPIMEKLENTSSSVETDRVKREFTKARDDFPDFMEWKEEMREIISAHPELTAEDIYLLARAKNPDKVKEIDGKLQDEKIKKEGTGKVQKMKAFGGLTPTSGTSEQSDGKKQPKEAASAAWDQVMSDVPSSLFGDAMEG